MRLKESLRNAFGPPVTPQLYRLFGGIQQYMSFDFYQNVIRWAITHQLFDIDLKEETWGNRMFQFFAGDLYEVFSEVQNKYYASEVVKGKCTAGTSGLSVFKNTPSSFNVTIKFDCVLQIRND